MHWIREAFVMQEAENIAQRIQTDAEKAKADFANK